ncbi:hypothetical protein HRR83_003946 [Exophiala dermatitidis]|uniref:Uncharacterized protein n=1 Tax=Exophiala dermatitidis TaxID=5970 RepID=A0AAN6EYV5_EXODE|nr:hypothetical protein HRR74_002669 [Exophiala dermatitidis]KAJ4529415.1 hypothetical protein HRR73_000438 [Exophiala dermatitidis]KAJ4543929.1 hypothetical protein HRR76_001988 [Exophiala dermatitidis]KAJ4549104.1 hypothetical protein HRR77_003982 [Exophiala dermatitidis]KAJ4575395.1 hypothetical protein HRR79_002317 [Exophiala dermatitidis]
MVRLWDLPRLRCSTHTPDVLLICATASAGYLGIAPSGQSPLSEQDHVDPHGPTQWESAYRTAALTRGAFLEHKFTTYIQAHLAHYRQQCRRSDTELRSHFSAMLSKALDNLLFLLFWSLGRGAIRQLS